MIPDYNLIHFSIPSVVLTLRIESNNWSSLYHLPDSGNCRCSDSDVIQGDADEWAGISCKRRVRAVWNQRLYPDLFLLEGSPTVLRCLHRMACPECQWNSFQRGLCEPIETLYRWLSITICSDS